MPHVSIRYKMYVPAGHHRQPRNPGGEIDLGHSGESDATPGSNVTPPYFDQLPYTLPMGGGSGTAQLIFWSVTEGSTGQVRDPVPIDQPVHTDAMIITGWYYPISGPGGIGNGSAIIDDAFSAALGRFIDDTFVTVTSDPSLTTNANVVGVVPTASAEVLVAAHSVTTTTEPFSRWMCFEAGTPSGDTDNVPAGANGIAIAIYQRPDTPPVGPIDPGRYAIGGTIIGGVAVDGNGAIIINGVPHPIDPWGPLVVRLVRQALVVAVSRSVDRKFSTQVAQVAAQDAVAALTKALATFEKQANR